MKRGKSYAKEKRRLWRCGVEAYPRLTSGTGRQGVRIEFSFGLMDTSRPGF